jgi:hypothetical protein
MFIKWDTASCVEIFTVCKLKSIIYLIAELASYENVRFIINLSISPSLKVSGYIVLCVYFIVAYDNK